jgi:hypothetical protein
VLTDIERGTPAIVTQKKTVCCFLSCGSGSIHLFQAEVLPPRSPGFCKICHGARRGRCCTLAAAPQLCRSDVLLSFSLNCGVLGGAVAGVWVPRKFGLPKRPGCWPGIYAGRRGPSSATVRLSYYLQNLCIVVGRGMREPWRGFPESFDCPRGQDAGIEHMRASLPVLQTPRFLSLVWNRD